MISLKITELLFDGTIILVSDNSSCYYTDSIEEYKDKYVIPSNNRFQSDLIMNKQNFEIQELSKILDSEQMTTEEEGKEDVKWIRWTYKTKNIKINKKWNDLPNIHIEEP